MWILKVPSVLAGHRTTGGPARALTEHCHLIVAMRVAGPRWGEECGGPRVLCAASDRVPCSLVAFSWGLQEKATRPRGGNRVSLASRAEARTLKTTKARERHPRTTSGQYTAQERRRVTPRKSQSTQAIMLYPCRTAHIMAARY